VLLALEQCKVEPEDIDEIKSWTCSTHIMQECGKKMVDTSEGFILTVDDRMFWDEVYKYMNVDETDVYRED